MVKISRRVISILAVLMMQMGVNATAQNSPEFSLALSPPIVTLPQGAVTSIGLTFESAENPPYTITFSGLPEGVQAQTSKIRGGSGTIVLYAGPDAALGTYAVQITAHAGKTSHTQILTLNIKPFVPVPQWEYTIVTADNDQEFLSYANRLGAEGWELVDVRVRETISPSFVGFFKRIKR